jgi:hypothetical protein
MFGAELHVVFRNVEFVNLCRDFWFFSYSSKLLLCTLLLQADCKISFGRLGSPRDFTDSTYASELQDPPNHPTPNTIYSPNGTFLQLLSTIQLHSPPIAISWPHFLADNCHAER